MEYGSEERKGKEGSATREQERKGWWNKELGT